ncbi:MAG: YceI family protein [Bacteroidota bacterium]|nr:YceI family protein [Bacteroidota bacterium]
MNNATTSTWKIDPGHSAIQFKIKHLAIANVAGGFVDFAGTVQTDQNDFAGARVLLEIEAASLGTHNEMRDTHLKSDAFLDVQQFPHLTFGGTLHKTAGSYALTGILTLCGVSKSITLEADFTGVGLGRWGDTRAGFAVKGQINRTDFGLTWKMLTDTGSLIVGENINLEMDIELIKEEVAAVAAS